MTIPITARKLLGIGLSVGVLAFSTACGSTDAGAVQGATPTSGTLTVATYPGAVETALKAAAKRFEAGTGIKVSVRSDSNYVSQSQVAVDHGNHPPVDMTIPDGGMVGDLIAGKYLAKIDYNVFDQENLAKLRDEDRTEYSVTTGRLADVLCYNTDKFPDGKPQPKSWADFFDGKKFPGTRGMRSWDNTPAPEFGLLADGVPTSKIYPLDPVAAVRKLSTVDIAYTPDPAAVLQSLVNGNFVMTPCLYHRVRKMAQDGAPVAFGIDQARLNSSMFVVWDKAVNKDAAMKFIAFLTTPQEQVAYYETSYVLPVNPAALELLKPEEIALFPTVEENDAFYRDDAWYAADSGKGGTNYDAIVTAFQEGLK
jgi:putative spermidine/putrescine transport system substrate-binding protein